MPYTSEQKREHIRELQRYLHGIDVSRGKSPAIIPDGVYSKETAEAVRQFQLEKSIPATGETDTATWDLIAKEYRLEMGKKPSSFSVFPTVDYVCNKGCGGVLVWVIQSILAELGKRYDNMMIIKINGDYTAETEAAVKNFQKICGLCPTGNVDSRTWNLLLVCWEHKL